MKPIIKRTSLVIVAVGLGLLARTFITALPVPAFAGLADPVAMALTEPADDDTATGSPNVENPLDSGQPCISVALPIFTNSKGCVDNTQTGGAILVYVKDAVKLLSGTIGGVIVLMIVIAGVQYITSMGNPANIAAAKKRITNAITALVIFLMAYAIINFLLPGGIAS